MAHGGALHPTLGIERSELELRAGHSLGTTLVPAFPKFAPPILAPSARWRCCASRQIPKMPPSARLASEQNDLELCDSNFGNAGLVDGPMRVAWPGRPI